MCRLQPSAHHVNTSHATFRSLSPMNTCACQPDPSTPGNTPSPITVSMALWDSALGAGLPVTDADCLQAPTYVQTKPLGHSQHLELYTIRQPVSVCAAIVSATYASLRVNPAPPVRLKLILHHDSDSSASCGDTSEPTAASSTETTLSTMHNLHAVDSAAKSTSVLVHIRRAIRDRRVQFGSAL